MNKYFTLFGIFSKKHSLQAVIIATSHLTCCNRETIHIGNDKHIYDDYGIFIDHSFEPNIKIHHDEIFALHDINIDDELTFNYNENECTIANPFYVNGILVCGNQEIDKVSS